VIGYKAIHAAEAYVLGLFQLYPAVYFHKATRGAEKLFTELLVRLVTLARNDAVARTGLPDRHPFIRFALSPEVLEIVIDLDDTVDTGALSLMVDSEDCLVSEYAKRLRDRKLYKCIDIRTHVSHEFYPECTGESDRVSKIDTCCAKVKENKPSGLMVAQQKRRGS
jgi:HD superfamily phosphohydrolase